MTNLKFCCFEIQTYGKKEETMRKICVITGTRAEYGLLYWLMKEIEADNEQN